MINLLNNAPSSLASSDTIATAICLFAQSKADENTVKDYERSLRFFFKQFGNLLIKELTDEMIVTFSNSITERVWRSEPDEEKTGNKKTVSPFYVASLIRKTKTFLKFVSLNLDGGVPFHYSLLQPPTPPLKIPALFADDQLCEIEEAICYSASTPWIQLRNHAIISLALNSGLSRDEIATLSLARYEEYKRNPRRGLYIVGRTPRNNYVSICPSTENLIDEYLEACPYLGWMLFLGSYGNPLQILSLNGITRVITKQLDFSFSLKLCREHFMVTYVLTLYHKEEKRIANELKEKMGLKTNHYTKSFVNSVLSNLDWYQ